MGRPGQRQIREQAEKAIQELRATTTQLTELAEEEITEHIRTRTIEIHGEDGRTPVKGVDYSDGEKGEPGPKGEPGADAVPDYEAIAHHVLTLIPEPEDLTEKLKELAEKKITIDDVNGLKAALERIARNRGGGGGGGGAGQMQHELKSISSATTTVSTTYKIAGAGTALIVAYNGQAIARGTDYTVGSDYKTLTLLFTPADSTVLLIQYMRG